MYIIHKQEDLVNLEKCFINVPNDAINLAIDDFSTHITYPSFVIHDNNIKFNTKGTYLFHYGSIIGEYIMFILLLYGTFNDYKYFVHKDIFINTIKFSYRNIKTNF